ncbi:hypothetical protein VOLCADRAFT_87659 [Volvox carteri f. nagariensis]|uniref:CCAAT-binding factor domain-containing protein n=1 Tax=Volvox carteri f. nagariensis TaxID=3068 RepID=D8TLX0_VOLCA|nr:uncharacterized protein VOLCADRAFT_87659 [Volvox carteri f. nagariensis]EFJ51407.1 hypothetical protein VOLCADRAFT_87659 [Volvox carteri f. nagariensis]|eukprot:XP_002947359.1 hypothetical protein VOLCADRAFT_87659 [Volvox carteri f. nagariensis]
MGAQEAPAGTKAGKVPGKKVDADALKHDVKAFASQLGLVRGGGGDDAFSDFAPSKAKQKIAPGSKPNKRQRLNDDAPVKGQVSSKGSAMLSQRQQPPANKENGTAKSAVRPSGRDKDSDGQANLHAKQRGSKAHGPKSAPAHHGGGSTDQGAEGDPTKARDWNFGVGPRPGEAKGFKSLLGKSDSNVWYRAAAALSSAAAASAAPGPPTSGVDPDLFERRRAAAEALMEAEAAAFEKELQRRNPSDANWLQQVRRAGTSTDKLAAATLLVQESVVANMKALDQLVSLATKRSGGKELVRQAMEGLQARLRSIGHDALRFLGAVGWGRVPGAARNLGTCLTELFTTVLLPDRKLRFLEQQPLQDLPSGRDGEKLLLLWWAEDCVKRRYAMFVAALEEHSRDNLEFLKEKSMRVIAELLSSKPECEARLLAALVNKLGDPSRKVASKAVYLLMQLLATHPVMKPVVVREVERFVFRPGLADKARYYAVVFLNQVPLSHRASEGGDALARQVISVYFTLFRMVVEGQIGVAAQLRKQQEERYAEEKKKFWREQRKAATARPGGRGGRGGRGRKPARPPPPPKMAVAEEVDARLLSGLITGVRRAFPYVKPEDVEPLVEQSASQLFRLVHTAPFTVAVQALMLMYQLMSARAAISDRYYRALYAALDRDGPTTSSRAPMFLALLFTAMRGDVSVKRVAAFAKRLLQLAAAAQPNWACGALMLISQVLSCQPALWASISHPEDLGGTGEEQFKDPDDDLLADGDDDDGVERFRDHDGSEDEDGNENGMGSHVGGKSSSHKGKKLRNGSAEGAKKKGGRRAAGSESEEAEEEEAELAGVELDLDGARRRTHALASPSGRDLAAPPPSGLLAAKAAAAAAKALAAVPSAWPLPSYYQMDKREPLYANADRSCWWELTVLGAHAHPSVSAMARSLLSGAPVVFDGDPLRDLSLVAFLDKFVNKKPKPVARGTSVMQPTAAPLGGALGSLQAAVAEAGGKKQPKQKQQQPRPVSLAQLSSEAFAALAEARVESADLFFHKFLNLKGVKDKRAARAEAKSSKKGQDGEGDEKDGAGGDESLSEAEDDEVDRYLEKQECMADDTLGGSEMGYDYDQLEAAMEADDLDDDDEEEQPGVDDDGDEDDADGEDEKMAADDDEEEDGSLDGVNILELPSPSADDEAEEEGDEAAAAARRQRHREAMKAAGISKADLEALSSDENDDVDEDDGAESSSEGGDGGSSSDGVEEEEDEDSGGDDEFLRMLAGGSDDEDVEMEEAGEDEDEDGDEAGPRPMSLAAGVRKGAKAGGNTGKKDKKAEGGGGKKGGGSLFASADDYAALIDRAEREQAEGRGGGEREGRGGGGGGGKGRGRGRGGDKGGRGAMAAARRENHGGRRGGGGARGRRGGRGGAGRRT